MMIENIKKSDIIIIVLSVLLLISFSCNFAPRNNTETVKVELRDTITIEKERIVTHTRPVYVCKFDTIIRYISSTDTVYVPVEIPITHYEYTDTIRTDSSECMLGIKYSGFKASLDDIGISYRFNREVPVKTKKSGLGWSVGLTGGVGASVNYYDKMFYPGPSVYVGVGFTFGYVKLLK